MAIFGGKPWVNPFGKMSIFGLFELLFYSLERRLFVLKYQKSHFPALNCLQKKNVRKMAIFGAKPWVNPFGKMSIFGLFQRLVFIAYTGVYSFQKIIKNIFLD